MGFDDYMKMQNEPQIPQQPAAKKRVIGGGRSLMNDAKKIPEEKK